MIAFLIVQEILQSRPFLVSQKFKTRGCQWYGIDQTKYVFVYKENNETRFGAPLYYHKLFSFLQ